MSEIIHTKFGNCSLNNMGRYRITSRKEGNHSKLLHILIWEDFYGCNVPDGFVIHHKNGNKQDNCILNLQLMREKEHRRLHGKLKNNSLENNPMYGKTHNLSSKLKMSHARSTTGIFRVYKRNPDAHNRFGWKYEITDEMGRRAYCSNDLLNLKKKVISNGEDWIIVNDEKVKHLCEEFDLDYGEVVS